MKDIRLGFAMCGSFCTHGQVLGELEKLCGRYKEITPILRPGRSEKEALLADGGFLPAGGDHRRGFGGPPAPASAALTAEADTGGGHHLRRCCCIYNVPFSLALSSGCYDFYAVLWYDEDNTRELSIPRKN